VLKFFLKKMIVNYEENAQGNVSWQNPGREELLPNFSGLCSLPLLLCFDRRSVLLVFKTVAMSGHKTSRVRGKISLSDIL
jgi:hypothetical protein